MLLLGLFISLLGVINIRGNISTIHKYNRRKVKEEDVKKYGKAVGTGTLVIGIFCFRLLCFVFERKNDGVYRSSGSSSRIWIYVVWAV